MLQVSWAGRGRFVVQLVPPDMVVLPCGCSLIPVYPRHVVVVVGVAVGLVFVMMVYTMAIAVLVCVIQVWRIIHWRLVWVQRGPVTLWRSAVLPHFVYKEYFGHVVNDEHLSPVRYRLGFSPTEMNVHDEDGEGGGGCDHGHGGNVVLAYTKGQRR